MYFRSRVGVKPGGSPPSDLSLESYFNDIPILGNDLPRMSRSAMKSPLLEVIDNLPNHVVPDKYLEGEFYRLSLGYRGIEKNSGKFGKDKSEAILRLIEMGVRQTQG